MYNCFNHLNKVEHISCGGVKMLYSHFGVVIKDGHPVDEASRRIYVHKEASASDIPRGSRKDGKMR
jgi:hypothetical protein